MENNKYKYTLGENVKYILIIIGFIVVFCIGLHIYMKSDYGLLMRASGDCQKRYEDYGYDYCETTVDGIPITCVELTMSSKTSCSFDSPSGRNPKVDVFTHYWNAN